MTTELKDARHDLYAVRTILQFAVPFRTLAHARIRPFVPYLCGISLFHQDGQSEVPQFHRE